jgi:putative endopeptidase
VAGKVSAFYGSFLDTAAIDKAGLAPLRPLLAGIDKLRSLRDLARWQGQVQGRLQTPVYLWVLPAFDNPGVARALTMQGGLGLPDRSYYLDETPHTAGARAAYATYLATLARLIGLPQPAHAAQRVMALERRLAQTHLPLADMQDPGNYVAMTPQELAAAAPGFDWLAWLEAAGVADSGKLTVSLPMARAVAALYAQVPLSDWQLYFKLRSVDSDASVLPKPLRDAHFAFHGTALHGMSAQAPRWQKAIIELNRTLGEAVGQLYAERHFSPQHKAQVRELVDRLLEAARETVGSAAWMSPATRDHALQKLAALGVKVGYPDRWRDYSALQLRRHDALGNRHRAARFDWLNQAARAGKAADRSAWMMLPQTVNAMYDPMFNEIVFPAAHLQPPYFDPAQDPAANYGAAGVLIAHEISHAFDQQGSQFDAAGVLRNWWSDLDRQAFGERANKLSAQFSAFQPLPGHHVDGKLTSNENLADLSALQIAFLAYRKASAGQSEAEARLGAQRFFVSYALSRRVKMRDETLLRYLSSDPHAPQKYRTNGPAANLDAFHDAFQTQPGDAMFMAKPERVRLW